MDPLLEQLAIATATALRDGTAEDGIYVETLARAFKIAIGQSPHRYILRQRIERAKELLRSTDMFIVDVALASGFSSQSHLSNWFIRELGTSPAVYRRQAFISH